MTRLIEILLTQTYKKLNTELETQIKDIDKEIGRLNTFVDSINNQIKNLNDQKHLLRTTQTDNNRIITRLEGYDCILSSSAEEAITSVSDFQTVHQNLSLEKESPGIVSEDDLRYGKSVSSKISMNDKNKTIKKRPTKTQRKSQQRKKVYYIDNLYTLK